jgi:hypothetical protein
MPMRPYTERDFDDMARRVVDKFASEQVPLADGAAHEAMQGQLNPDQIERLVQAANTMAFLRMMEEREQGKGGAGGMLDLTGEFDPADTRGVIQHILHQTPGMGGGEAPAGPQAAPEGDEWSPLPDEMAAHRGAHPATCVDAPGEGGPAPHASMCEDEETGGAFPAKKPAGPPGAKSPPIDDDNDGPFPKGEKQKAKDDGDKDKKEKKKPPAKDPEKDEKLAAVVHDRRMRKLADQLEDQLLQAELAFDDGYARLGQALKVAHGAPKIEELEKDAVALDGGPYTVAVLNLVREERGLEALDAKIAAEKHAALQDRHVVSDYPALRELEKLVKIAAEADKLRRGAEYVRSQCA